MQRTQLMNCVSSCMVGGKSVNNTILVIGGNGFIGFSVIKELVKRGIRVRCLDLNFPDNQFRFPSVEYCIGDIWDNSFLQKSLTNVNCVMDFVSTSMPNSNDVTLSNEISKTLKYHDYILSNLKQSNVNKYIFPSSGGAIYGNKNSGLAYENDALRPITPYGVGKKLTEEILRYYYERCNICSCILRIGNVYGSPRIRNKAQGVIDVFAQNALRDETITIWGNAIDSVRDYIYLEDVAEAVVDISQKGFNELKIYNVGTGIGTNLAQIIRSLSKLLNKDIKCEYKKTMASGIDSIVLSNEKIRNEIGWKPKVSLEEGIKRTLEIKRVLLNV